MPRSALAGRSNLTENTGARTARWIAVSLAAVNLAFIVGLVLALSDNGPLIGDFSRLRALLMLPLLGALLTALIGVFSVIAWLRGYRSAAARVHYTALALARLAFWWFTWNWNLLGPHL
jgi:hypothetical protein